MTVAVAYRAARNALLAAEILLLGWLFATEDLAQLGFLILAIGGVLCAVAIIFSGWPIGCFLLLTIGAAMPRFSATLFGLHVRPEHVATSLAILATVVQAFRGRIQLSLRLMTFDYWLLGYVGMNFFSSVVTSPQPRMTLRWATLNAIVVIPYFLVRVLVRTDREVWLALRVLLCVGVAEAIYGTIATLANHIAGTTWGVQLGQYGSVPGTYGTQYEANLFGSYTACAAVMFLALFLLSKEQRRMWYGWGLMFSLLGAFFSLARTVLLALPVPIIVLLWISVKKGQFQLRRLLPVAIGVGLVLAMLSPFVIEYVSARFSAIDVSEGSVDASTFGRLVQMDIALDDVKSNPVFGTGTASFQLLFKLSDLGVAVNYADETDAGWISNTPLRVLHDIGVVGLAIFLVFLTVLAKATYRALRIATHTTKVSMLALSAGLLLYAVTFQATEATLLTFTWIHFGLLATAAAITLDPRRLTASVRNE
jgi:O-antigen ligase